MDFNDLTIEKFIKEKNMKFKRQVRTSQKEFVNVYQIIQMSDTDAGPLAVLL